MARRRATLRRWSEPTRRGIARMALDDALDGSAAPLQPIEIVKVDGCLDGCSTVRRMGCKPLKSLPRRTATHLSRGTPYTPIEPYRGRARARPWGFRRQTDAEAYRPAMELNRESNTRADTHPVGRSCAPSSPAIRKGAAPRSSPPAWQNVLSVPPQVEPGRVEADPQRQRDRRRAHRARLGRGVCTRSDGEIVGRCSRRCAPHGPRRRPQLPVTALIETSPIRVHK
jgi:hypothetical protein